VYPPSLPCNVGSSRQAGPLTPAQEFILLSDILGLSLLVDSISHPKPAHSTEGSLLGPFHVHAPPVLQNGEELSHDANGDPCLVVCTVKDSAGRPIAGVNIDIWETDSSGHYDVQHADRDGPDGRCVMTSDAKGEFWFKAIRPVSYPIPHDGPVGQLLKKLHRHPWRPAHMHFMFSAPGYDNLITALYIAGDPYITSDAVFGVKTSLIKEIGTVDGEYAEWYGVPEGTGLLEYGFVLVSEEETLQLRDGLARREWERLFPGRKVKLVDNLPVPDLD
jgi:protocatechuate 3,4-dioxygenase beta subunit